MTTIREQGYRYFLQEAPELLQALEQDLLTLREDCSINKVHNLMRTTHTLKGAAASVGLETIKTVAHYLEDIFKALCKPDISIDPEVEALLFEGYECLRLPLTAELTGGQVDEAGVKSRTAAVFAQLEEKLGDCFTEEAHLPSSVELGFDVTQSIFEVGVTQRLEELAAVLESGQLMEVATSLRTQAEVFLGLAESLVLPGFGDIARSAIAALDAHPEQAQMIAEISLADFREGQEAVLNGDRSLGGSPSVALQELAVIGEDAGTRGRGDGEIGKWGDGEDKGDKEDKGDEVDEIIFTLAEELHNQESVTQLEVEGVTDAVELKNEALADSLLEVIWGGTEELEENVAVTDDSIFISLDDELEENTAIADDAAFISVDDELEEELAVVYDSALVSWEEESGEDVKVSNDLDSINLAEEEGGANKEEKEKSSPQSPTIPTLTELPSTVRVKVQHLEHLNYSVGELLTNHNRQLLQNEQLQAAVKTLVTRFQEHRQLLDQLRDGEINSKFKIQNSKLPLRSIVSKARHNNQQQTTNNQQNFFDSLELDEYSETQLLIQSVLEDAVQLAEANDAIELFARQSYQTLETQRRLLTSTRDVLMEVRMVSLGDIFAPLPRVIRQLEVRHHKPVTLEIRGTEVMVDKVVAQKLYDPLLHLVRNAFDHGVESPEIRREQGKEEKGQIRVCAYYRGRYLVIEVGDDGQGLDFERIRQRALVSQLVSAQQAPLLSEAELKELLFEPGFSTNSEVNDLSGRGIGLDVVRAQLRALQGLVEVNSEFNQGTTFVLRIPQNLTISQLLLCQAGNRTYALLAEAIEQILIPRPEQLKCWEDGKVLRWENDDSEQLIPIYRLENILDYSLNSPDQPTLASQPQVMPLMLIRCQDQLLGLEVDQLLGDQELVIRPLEKVITPPNYVYGSSILANGQLALVVDGVALMHEASQRQISKEQSAVENQFVLPAGRGKTRADVPALPYADDVVNLTPRTLGPSQKQQRLTPQTRNALPGAPVSNLGGNSSKMVLLVDDSITLRQTLAMTLEKANYRVLQAKDGYEALEKLQQQTDIQLVICDIEMPRMNGFEFLKHRQQDPELAGIPVVILTSRSGEKHRLIATELGATTYLTKPYLEQELLNKVRNAFG